MHNYLQKIIILNVGVFLLQVVLAFGFNGDVVSSYFGLNPWMVVHHWYFWQPINYMFLHSTEMPLHILFNMYLLWIFGSAVEDFWGSKKFLLYYLFTGFGAGIVIFVFNYFFAPMTSTIGASGAVLAVLFAFGLLFPNVELLLFFLIPIKAKYLVIFYALIEFFFLLNNNNSNISHIGHLGGLLFGAIFFVIFERKGSTLARFGKPNILSKIQNLKETVVQDRETKQLDVQVNEIKNIFPDASSSNYRRGQSAENDQKLNNLLTNLSTSDFQSMCETYDFGREDSVCKQCSLFRACLYREITGEEPKKSFLKKQN